MFTGVLGKDTEAVDLRRPSDAASALGAPAVLVFYRAVFGLAVAATLASILLELCLSFTPSTLPFSEIEYTYGLDHFGRDTSAAGWRVSEVRPERTAVRARDLILTFEGTPSLDLLRSLDAVRRLDRQLRERGSIAATLRREPDFTRRPFSAWSFLALTHSSGGNRSRSVELDSTHTGLGLEEAVRRFDPSLAAVCPSGPGSCPDDEPVLGVIPPEVDLAAAEAALAEHDSTLLSLPVGTELRLGLRGDDFALPVLSVSPPSGAAVQLEEADGGWTVIPSGTYTERLALGRRPWTESLESVSGRVALLLIGLMGLLTLRARSASRALRHFVVLCTLPVLLSVPALWQSWQRLRAPLSGTLSFDQYIRYPSRDGTFNTFTLITMNEVAILVAGIVGAGLLLVTALRLLQTFPSPDADLASRFGVPRRGLVIGAILSLASLLLVEWGSPATGRLIWQTRLVFFILLVFLVGALLLLLQIARLGWARMRQPRSGKEAAQARLALFGLSVGGILAFAMAIMPGWYRMSSPWTVTLYDATQAIRTAALPIALALPFLGFFLAIARRGLWDVDTIIERATVLSALTVLFVLMWLGLEVSLEALLQDRLAGVPLAGSLLPAALSGGLVAGSRRWIGTLVSRRLDKDGTDFGNALQTLASDLGGVGDTTRLPAVLVSRIHKLLRPACCALLLRQGDGERWRAWNSGDGVPAGAVTAASLGRLESERDQVVLLDDGPVLVSRLERSHEIAGVLIMGMRPGGRFYSTEERQMLSVLLGTLGPRLAR